MQKRIAILGPTGAVGSALTGQVLRARLLQAGDELQLVGRGIPTSQRKLLAIRADLMDAFDDAEIRIEVVPDVSEVEADIVIIAAGVTASSPKETRRDLATVNHAIFKRIADQCVARLSKALFIVVSNPVELAVKIFSFAGDRKRVIGMGAEQDSLRFARAIATDLGVSRRNIRATVLGEHGDAMLPIWSSIEVTADDPQAAGRLSKLHLRSLEAPLPIRVATLRTAVRRLLSEERTSEAYALAQRALPDARIFVEPSITFDRLHSTPNATANATFQYIAAALTNDGPRLHGQVDLRGEVLGLHGVCGIPLTIRGNEWQPEKLDWLDSDEIRALKKSTQSIEEFITGTLIDAVRRILPPESRWVFAE